ncbi:MAG: anthranilate phosphoribosyltransferase [Methanomassiliicoccales archaeon]|nr:anthranilate phosphoribosyltransferase [Methanomassiliicoccales archaeon]NYT15677.1 anthranilate phosphoribosyltransferase [Methanomassiliicoccales archaeon]
MIRDSISRVVEGTDLSTDESSEVMREIITGQATPSQIGSFITAMRMKGETVEELLGFVKVMREMGQKIRSPLSAIDVCGTGGDATGTFNISTTASFVICASGLPVAKHGNRSISSMSGSADVLHVLGIPNDLDPLSVEKCLESTGIGFMFAPIFHDSMRNVLAPRKEIGIRTFFNLLGPLANPAGVKRQLIGVYDPDIAPMVCKVMQRLGSDRVMVVHGSGMDEITTLGRTRIVEIIEGEMRDYTIEPKDFGIDVAPLDRLKGGNPTENARILLSILKGENSPRADIVALNAGAGLYIGGRAVSIHDGFEIAREILRNGSAFAKLEQFTFKCLELEEKRQISMQASELSERRILSHILSQKSRELSEHLLDQILGSEVEHHLENLEKDLIDDPNVLTYIMLRRILDLPRITVPEFKLNRSKTALAQAVSNDSGVSVIGEYKPTSPTAAALSIPPDPESVIEAYELAGMAGVSVLVESSMFGGGTELFASIRSTVNLPMLFKDFVISPKQIDVADNLGADSVLLIASALEIEFLDEMIHNCLLKGMEPLIELHSKDDVAKLNSLSNLDKVDLVGVNTRNLKTLDVDMENLSRIGPLLDGNRLTIAESGIRSIQELDMVKGYDGVLIGSMFMGSPDIARAVGMVIDRCREVYA